MAAYEKAPDEVAVTIEEMELDGFGTNPIFQFFVAEVDGKTVGISLYYIKYSTWKGRCVFLEDIIVTEEYRKYGIGKKLFDEVVKVAKEMGARRMEWQVTLVLSKAPLINSSSFVQRNLAVISAVLIWLIVSIISELGL